MADKGGPNWKVEQLKQRISIDTLGVNLFRSQLEITEAEGRIAAANKNIESTHKAIVEGQRRLEELIDKHGDLTEE